MSTEGISKNELKEILTEVIRAVKEPTAIEQKKLDAAAEVEQAKQESRKRQAGQVLEQLENTKAVQQICSHAHKSGDSHCVFVMEQGTPGYVLCQKCQAIVRPGNPPKGYKGNHIYNTVLFNQLFQRVPNQEIFG